MKHVIKSKLRISTSNNSTFQYKESTPTNLIRHLSEQTIDKFHGLTKSLFDCIIESSPEKTVSIQNKIKGQTIENVSDINSLALTAMYEMSYTKRIPTICKMMNIPSFIKRQAQEKDEWSISDFLRIANYYESTNSGFINRLYQIKDYSWMTQQQVNQCMDNIQSFVNKYMDGDTMYGFEYPVKTIHTHTITDDIMISLKMNGRIDAVSHLYFIEFKCVHELTIEHFLQVIIYAWMVNHSNDDFIHEKDKEFILLNIRDGQCYQLRKDWYTIDLIMNRIIQNKYKPTETMNRNEFIKQYSNIDLPYIQTENMIGVL